MNLKNVLRTYTLLRQLTDDESALLNTLRALNDSERELLVESLSPAKPTGRKGASKSSRQVGKSSSKSSRASGMAAAINRSLNQQRQVTTKNDSETCGFVHGDGNGHVCGLLPDHNIHHLQNYIDYHEFVSEKSSARSAGEKSSTNGGAITSTQSIEDEEASAGVAAGGSGE